MLYVSFFVACSVVSQFVLADDWPVWVPGTVVIE